jgi:hypothetical protein
MVGNSKPHGTQPPPAGQLLWSLGSLGQSYHEHKLAGTQEAILDLWETSLYDATWKLVQVLCTGHN